MILQREQLLLLFSAIGLIPIALSYGFNPQLSMSYLFNIDIESVNATHILRAVMGLYFLHLIFWLIGVFIKHLRQFAMVTLAVFMLGLAMGRAISFIIYGWPNWLLILYFTLECSLGLAAVYCLQMNSRAK
jgi:hypothetical protein